MIAHDGQIGSSRDAHSHDGRHLRNAHRAHHGVIAEDPAKIVRVREYVLLKRQKNARGIHEINCWNAILDRDVLRANHFFRGHREESAGLHCRVVGDDHEQPPAHLRQARDRAGRGCAAPLLVHAERGVEAQFKERRFGVDQFGDAFARREAALLVLRFDGFRAAALLQDRFLVLDFGEEIHHAARVGLKSRGG